MASGALSSAPLRSWRLNLMLAATPHCLKKTSTLIRRSPPAGGGMPLHPCTNFKSSASSSPSLAYSLPCPSSLSFFSSPSFSSSAFSPPPPLPTYSFSSTFSSSISIPSFPTFCSSSCDLFPLLPILLILLLFLPLSDVLAVEPRWNYTPCSRR